MKRMIIALVLLGVLGLLLTACGNDDCEQDADSPVVTPEVTAVVEPVDSLYNGVLEVYPCVGGTSIYYGNYLSSGNLSVIPGYYYMVDGLVNPSLYYAPIRLPIGTYTMVYWGYPTLMTDLVGEQDAPPLTSNVDLSTLYFSLRPYKGDSTYLSSQELTYGIQHVRIGSDSLKAQLRYATSMLNVNVLNSSGESLPSIDTMWVQVGGIYSQLNFYSAQVAGNTVQVAAALNRNADSTKWSCQTVSLFPSAANPLFKLFVRLTNGTQKVFQQPLANSLSAGTNNTLTILLNATLSTESQTQAFTIDDWIEQRDTIEIPTW